MELCRSKAVEICDFRTLAPGRWAPPFTMDEAELQARLDRLRNRHGLMTEAGRVEPDDFVALDSESDTPKFQKTNLNLRVGRGLFSPELEEGILGMAPGETRITAMSEFLNSVPIQVRHAETGHIFDIRITAFRGTDSASVRIVDYHTNVVSIRRNDQILLEKELTQQRDEGLTDRTCLSVEGIVDFADSVDLADVRETLERQIQYNMAIAAEGLRGNYGANIGKTVLLHRENDINYQMRAWAAATSDARMNGCELPVVINSGSGNQGITASVPVIVYARQTGKTHEELLRALCVSNLITTHLKTGIGRLSAYCGAVSAGVGAGAGIAYLKGGRYEVIAHTIVNAVAVTSGIVCDGAKASCAAKIAAAVDAGLLGLAMYENGSQFFGGDGIVKKGVENTIATVGKLARFGMEQTDKEIIRLMLEC
ncbi:MAG: L-serine ammonia-lyase, iron-sulfur-dependent, subunit alpha [Oscillospiraceae bacterium]|nr:L-serine ammonia-lyase, iron-sulfur-dependent, subunit alpha [Oscillospiraceae bacterium]